VASDRIEHYEERRAARPWHLATGSLACPDCDAPVALGPAPAGPADPLMCPYCDHGGPLRDFLSLAAPARAPRVHVLVRLATT
jgi:hypothetical protein